jgi:hypothetical protein
MNVQKGDTVIVTQDNVNRVGVVLDKFIVNKRTVYDVLLENFSAVCMIGTTKCGTYINSSLTKSLCQSGQIETTVPYSKLVESEMLPITKS